MLFCPKGVSCRRAGVLALVLMLLVWLGARPLPVQASQAMVGGDSPEGRLMVEASWLKSRTGAPNLVVVDARPAAAYASGHIPGAVNIPVALTFSPAKPTYYVGPIHYIENLLGDAGIGNQSDVVVYDQGDYLAAARIFWVLEVYGQRRVALLDGGYAVWQVRGLATSTAVTQPEAKTFIASIQPQYLATKLHTRLAIEDGGKVLIDARTAAEYRGEKSRARRFGHIPGAINIPWNKNLRRVDGREYLRPLEKLEALYSGIGADKKIITYCNAGRHSSVTYFVLRRLGRDVSHYDGSWLEWGDDPELPIEK